MTISWRVAEVRRFASLAMRLALRDLRNQYRRTVFGTAWITLTLSAQIATLGLVFTYALREEAGAYIPFLASGLLLWNLVTMSVNESTNAYAASAQILNQAPVPHFFLIVRLLSKNLLIFGHNLIVVLFVLAAYGVPIGWNQWLVVPGFLLLIMNLFWLAGISSLIGVRYRDYSPLVSSAFIVLFYLTPIIWLPSSLPPAISAVLTQLNPIYHLISVVRLPLLGEAPPASSWIILSLITVAGLVSHSYLAKRFAWKAIYWM